MNTLRVASPLALRDDELAAWNTLASEMPRFHSPFLHPEYVRALARFRPQIEVAVMARDGRPNGFFAYERHGKSAMPLGVKLADFEGVVHGEDCVWSENAILKSSGLTTCEFHHLVPEGSPFAGSIVQLDESPFIDLSQGFAKYLEVMKAKGSPLISQTQRKQRKLQKDIGTVEFTWNDPDISAWESLLIWKSAQRARTKTFNVLEFPWVRDFLRQITRLDASGLCGALSTLRVNGRVIAVHLGMHTQSRFHYWFPAYDPEFSRYSPGLVLLLMFAERAVARGIERIDLGKGDDAYKACVASSAELVGTAICDLCSPRRLLKTSWLKLQSSIRNSRFRSIVQAPKRFIRRRQTQTAMG